MKEIDDDDDDLHFDAEFELLSGEPPFRWPTLEALDRLWNCQAWHDDRAFDDDRDIFDIACDDEG